jgi:hypothetical protein
MSNNEYVYSIQSNINKPIKYFTILGERCSGTNFLEQTMRENFDVELTWEFGHKHFFGFHQFSHTNKENETLFIGIVREPISWISSFYRNPHHLPEKKKYIMNFLLGLFYSITDNTKTIKKDDLNYKTNKIYRNIFELRKIKNEYLMERMPQNVDNYILFTYENLNQNTDQILNVISQKYNLPFKNNIIKKINYYKDDKNKEFIPINKTFKPFINKIIINNLDKAQEKKLGYDI